MTNITSKKLSAAALACTLIVTPNVNAEQIGLWDFENTGDLAAATIGSDLTATGTGFTAVAGSGGADAGAVKIEVGSHYAMDHGIALTGGESYVNTYTLLIDFKLDTATTNTWTTIFQTNQANSGDADYFYRNDGTSELGVQSEDYVGPAGTVALDQWHRLVVSVDQGVANETYLDGVHIGSHNVNAN